MREESSGKWDLTFKTRIKDYAGLNIIWPSELIECENVCSGMEAINRKE